MELIVIDSAAFRKLQQEQKQLIKDAIKEAKLEALIQMSPEADWIDIKEAKKILPYGSKTKWAELRNSGAVVFSQFGRKIMYSRKSLHEFLLKNKIKSK